MNYIGAVEGAAGIRSPIDATLAAAGASVLHVAVRRVPRARRHAHGHGDPGRRRSAPIAHRLDMWTPARRPRTTRTAKATPGSSRTSARRPATRPCRSTASGCARRICTTARCRRSRICSSRSTSGRRSSGAATTSSTRRASASSRSGAEAERIGTPFDVTLPGNSNAGHTYGDRPDARAETRAARVPEDAVTRDR